MPLNIVKIVICFMQFNLWCALLRFSDSNEGPPPFTGALALNNELQRAKRLFEGELVAPEAFAADKDGNYY